MNLIIDKGLVMLWTNAPVYRNISRFGRLSSFRVFLMRLHWELDNTNVTCFRWFSVGKTWWTGPTVITGSDRIIITPMRELYNHHQQLLTFWTAEQGFVL